jgi:hypothetical protein
MTTPEMDRYPYLKTLLGGYFHQDAYDDAENDDEVVEEFIATSWPYQRLGVRADIGRFLHEHPEGLLAALERTFSPGVILATDDAGVRAWLLKVEAALKE